METEGIRISPLDDFGIHAGNSLLGNARRLEYKFDFSGVRTLLSDFNGLDANECGAGD
jgi:hypothetical protein